MNIIAKTDSIVNRQYVKQIFVWDQARWDWQRVDKLPARIGFLVVEGQPGYWPEDLPGFKVEAQL